jgi:hypothetical protein
MGGQDKVIQMDEWMRVKQKYNRGWLLGADLPAERDNEYEGDHRHCNRIEGPWVFGMATRLDDGVVENAFLLLKGVIDQLCMELSVQRLSLAPLFIRMNGEHTAVSMTMAMFIKP